MDELDRLRRRGTPRELLREQLGVEADRVQGVPDLVGDLGGDPPYRGEPLRPAQLIALPGERRRHRVELAGEQAELVVALQLDLAREVTRGDCLHALRQRLDGREEALRDERRAGADREGEQRVDDGEEDGPALRPLRRVHPVGDLGLERNLKELHVERESFLELADLLRARLEGRARPRVLALPRLERVEERAGLVIVLLPAGVEGVEPNRDLVEEARLVAAGERARLAGHPAALVDLVVDEPGETGPRDGQVDLPRAAIERARLERPGRHPVLHLELRRDAGEGEIAAGEEAKVAPDLVEPHDAEARHRREGEERDREGEEDLCGDVPHRRAILVRSGPRRLSGRGPPARPAPFSPDPLPPPCDPGYEGNLPGAPSMNAFPIVALVGVLAAIGFFLSARTAKAALAERIAAEEKLRAELEAVRKAAQESRAEAKERREEAMQLRADLERAKKKAFDQQETAKRIGGAPALRDEVDKLAARVAEARAEAEHQAARARGLEKDLEKAAAELARTLARARGGRGEARRREGAGGSGRDEAHRDAQEARRRRQGSQGGARPARDGEAGLRRPEGRDRARARPVRRAEAPLRRAAQGPRRARRGGAASGARGAAARGGGRRGQPRRAGRTPGGARREAGRRLAGGAGPRSASAFAPAREHLGLEQAHHEALRPALRDPRLVRVPEALRVAPSLLGDEAQHSGGEHVVHPRRRDVALGAEEELRRARHRRPVPASHRLEQGHVALLDGRETTRAPGGLHFLPDRVGFGGGEIGRAH